MMSFTQKTSLSIRLYPVVPIGNKALQFLVDQQYRKSNASVKSSSANIISKDAKYYE